MFADDIKLYRSIHSLEDCLILQNDINVLLNWSKHWLLSFNVAKCKVLHIGNTPYTGDYSLDGTQLELLENIRDLGIQRKATRMIPSISHLPYHDRLRQLNLPSLQHHRRRGDLIYLYQIFKGTYDLHNQFLPHTTQLQEVTRRNYLSITQIHM